MAHARRDRGQRPQAQRYRSRFGGSVPIHVIPNGIPREFRRPREQATRPAMIIEVARVVAQKRPDVWLTAVAEVLDAYPQLDAAWWGPPSGDTGFDEELAASASRAGLGHVFQGPTSTPASAYARGDILAHAATREAHSVGLLEAAAMGLVVVCSTSVARDLPNDFPAVTFRDEDPGHLASRLGEVIAEWEPHSRRAHAYAAEIAATYSAEECARRYLRILGGAG
ncbi:glycosyltransferase [Leifsonia sp. L25]|uniref:glycosyltransferase n=1 Tax=Actinomycetes TaxID=1760 RepID=UPI003D6832A2